MIGLLLLFSGNSHTIYVKINEFNIKFGSQVLRQRPNFNSKKDIIFLVINFRDILKYK